MSEATPANPTALLIRFCLFSAFWLILSGFEPGGLIFGMIASLSATGLSVRLLPINAGGEFRRALPMLPRFLWRSLLGGIDVARRALDPRMPLAPAWRRVRCRVTPGGRFLIGSEFSLMPGTLIAGCRQGCYLVHLLDGNQEIITAITREEQHLAAALGNDQSTKEAETEKTTPGNAEPS